MRSENAANTGWQQSIKRISIFNQRKCENPAINAVIGGKSAAA